MGLAVSPALAAGSSPPPAAVLALAAGAGIALSLVRPGGGGGLAIFAWLASVGLAAIVCGLGIGAARVDAIDAAAYRGPPGQAVRVRGFVEAVPRRADGEVRVRVATGDGRVLVEGHEPIPELPVGREVRARGVVREPRPWEAGYLARSGVARVVEADFVRLGAARRGGLVALADRVRERAEGALERGTPPAQAALLRGFVLGEDDRIEAATAEEFRRSGLAHLLAVSGQNVVLLALLASFVLALLGIPLRARLICVLALIALYVPVTGAGPSIQRAGIMGAAGIVAALASRPRSRWYAVLLAAAATLSLNPRASGDVGWQLSFAAVLGILLWAGSLRDALLGSRRGGNAAASAARRALLDGVGVTVAATAATAPLMAHHFGALSVVALPANLLALPAVAPVMWLGMASGAAGQLPSIPVEPLTWLGGLLAAYVAQVAHWFAVPGWAQADVGSPDVPAVAVSYALLGASLGVATAVLRRRVGLGASRGARAAGLAALASAALLLSALVAGGSSMSSGDAPPGLEVRMLDVGQGDAILLDPQPGDPVLVDGGPPDGGVRERLGEIGVDRLAAAVLTHDQSDHAGGLAAVLADVTTGSLVFGRRPAGLLPAARAVGAEAVRVAAGDRIESGPLVIEVLWPPSQHAGGEHPTEDPNLVSLVLVARWRDFEILLTGDAEAESVPIDPGPVDVLKVAHHGSADEGLDGLLDRSSPRVALISVGERNTYGHPAADTLSTLAEHGVLALRTDRDGELTIEAGDGDWTAGTGG